MALRLKNPFARGPSAGRGAGPDRRSLVRTGTLGAGLVLIAALVVIVNYFGWKYHVRGDWTASQLYDLSGKTENVLAGLDRDVEAVVFLPPGDALSDPTREVLARYEAASQRFSVRYLDPERNPLEAQRLADEYDVTGYSVVMIAGDQRRVIQRDALADFDFSGLQAGRGAEVKAYKGEQLFTSALIDLAEERQPKVLFTTGHGEIRLDDQSAGGLGSLAQRLRDDNFEVEEWASIGQAAVPADTDLVVIAGPTSNFLPPELELFDRFLADGGRMLVLLDPVLARAGTGELLETGLEGWLAGWGVEVGNDVAIDPSNPVPFFGGETIYVAGYGSHPITRSVQEARLPVLVSLARSVGTGSTPDGYRSTVLMRTSAEGWGETDVSTGEVARDDADLAGPVPLGVVVEAEEGEDGDDGFGEVGDADEADLDGEGENGGAVEAADASTDDAGAELTRRRGPMRLVVFGDSNFASDQFLGFNQVNAVLLIDTLNWLAERESLLGIPPKEPERVRLSMTPAQQTKVNLLALAILPGLAVILGVTVWLRRRR